MCIFHIFILSFSLILFLPTYTHRRRYTRSHTQSHTLTETSIHFLTLLPLLILPFLPVPPESFLPVTETVLQYTAGSMKKKVEGQKERRKSKRREKRFASLSLQVRHSRNLRKMWNHPPSLSYKLLNVRDKRF